MNLTVEIHAVNNARTCHQCGLAFIPSRHTARYCSPACRQAHHRGDEPKTWRPCEGLDCDEELGPWMRRDARYCSPACQAHDYYAYGGPPIRAGMLADVGALLEVDR